MDTNTQPTFVPSSLPVNTPSHLRSWCTPLSSCSSSFTSQTFHYPHPVATFPPPPPHRIVPRASAGKGFGKASPPPPPDPKKKGGNFYNPQANWVVKYKEFIAKNGRHLCAMSYEGYQQLGRGAIFAKDAESSVKDQVAKVEAHTSFYAPKDKVVLSEGSIGDKASYDEIISRIDSYDPEKQFVVVFQTSDLMGADIVKPNSPCKDVVETLKKEATEREKAELEKMVNENDGLNLDDPDLDDDKNKNASDAKIWTPSDPKKAKAEKLWIPGEDYELYT